MLMLAPIPAVTCVRGLHASSGIHSYLNDVFQDLQVASSWLLNIEIKLMVNRSTSSNSKLCTCDSIDSVTASILK